MSAFPSTAQQLKPNDLYPVRDDVVLIDGPLRLMCGRMPDKLRVACRLAGEPGLPVLLVPGGTGCLALADSIYGHDAFLREVSAANDIIREHPESKQ